MSSKPLKWLRHVGWCFYGGLGSLSTEPEGQPIDAAEEETTNDFAAEYYYIAEGPPRYMDLDMLREYSATGTQQMRQRFRIPIFDRDGGVCSFMEGHTDAENRMTPTHPSANTHVEAAHIIPHCKGDEYVEIFEKVRGVPPEMRLSDVDDIRNGILIWLPLHKMLSDGDATILLVPNKYMDVADAPAGPDERTDWPPANSDPKEYKDSRERHTYDDAEERPLSPTPSRESDTSYQDLDAVEFTPRTDYNLKSSDQTVVPEHSDDIPNTIEDSHLDSGYIPFTPDSRLVLQHLVKPMSMYRTSLPNNLRAALRPWTRLSPAALRASYGCAIFNRFGVVPCLPSPSSNHKEEEDTEEEDGPDRKRPKLSAPSVRFSRHRAHEMSSSAIADMFHPPNKTKGNRQRPMVAEGEAEGGLDRGWNFLLSVHRPPRHVIKQHQDRLKTHIQDWSSRVPVALEVDQLNHVSVSLFSGH